jgi:hypothetical protein
MKTELQKHLATLAPHIRMQTSWSHDPAYSDIREDVCGMEDENPDDWQAWASEVRATCIQDGEEISGSAYLGGTWEKAGDVPEESNPTISGYELDMTVEALRKLAAQVSGEDLLEEIGSALHYLRGTPATMEPLPEIPA